MKHQVGELANQVRQLAAERESVFLQHQQERQQRDTQLAEMRVTVAAIQAR